MFIPNVFREHPRDDGCEKSWIVVQRFSTLSKKRLYPENRRSYCLAPCKMTFLFVTNILFISNRKLLMHSYDWHLLLILGIIDSPLENALLV